MLLDYLNEWYSHNEDSDVGNGGRRWVSWETTKKMVWWHRGLVKTVMLGMVEGDRSRGRRPRRWSDDMTDWSLLGADRQRTVETNDWPQQTTELYRRSICHLTCYFSVSMCRQLQAKMTIAISETTSAMWWVDYSAC